MVTFAVQTPAAESPSGVAVAGAVHQRHWRLALRDSVPRVALNYRSHSLSGRFSSDYSGFAVRADLLPVSSGFSYNSTYPDGGNDRAQWQGRGVNASLDAGVRLVFPFGAVTIAPQVWAAQNARYDMMPSVTASRYGYFTGGHDLYQRPGGDALARWSWGESEVRVGLGSFSIGFGTQSVWLGPARRNPILMSTNAPGFPRVDLGISATPTRIGLVEARVFWGATTESAYFDDDPSNDRVLFSGLSVSLAPDVVPGLVIGFHRTVRSPWRNLAREAFVMFGVEMNQALGRDDRDQRAGLTIEWRFPAVGFTAYGEWIRNDYSPEIDFTVGAPGHSQAYTLGIAQGIAFPRFQLTLSGELTQLILTRDYYIGLGVSQNGFYSHGTLRQGYTNEGQIVGAAIGPGGNSQYVSADIDFAFYSAGLFVERRARDQDYLYGGPLGVPGNVELLNAEIRIGGRFGRDFAAGSRVFAEVSIGRNYSRNWENDNDVNNVRAVLGYSRNLR